MQVGVHIADVSYFVREGTPLDVEAARRATTVREHEHEHEDKERLLCWSCHHNMTDMIPSHLVHHNIHTLTGVPGAEGGAHAPAPPLRAALQVRAPVSL